MRIEHWLYELPLRLRSLVRRRRVDAELDEEMAYHVERETEELIARGTTPAEARRAARRAMDGLTLRKEECRDARGLNPIDNTLGDIRYGLRVLAKAPGFTLVAILTLALAIGANSTVFAVLNALILRPLNVPQGETLWGTEYGIDNGFHSYPNYLDLRQRNRSFEDLAAFNFLFVSLDAGHSPSSATGFGTTLNYFDVLRIQPYLGRFYRTGEDRGLNSAPYIVLSYAYWHSRFQDDRGLIGRTVEMNRRPLTVIGVAPPGFRGTLMFVSPDFFTPTTNQDRVDGVSPLDVRGNPRALFETFGHLKPGVTPAQALADLKRVGAYLAATYPKEFAQNQYELGRTGLTSFGGAVNVFMAGLMALAGLILLAACANLGGLFAARSTDRAKELALRLALGSSRNRIVRQLLTEAMLVSVAGGALGLLGSLFLLSRMADWQPFARAPVHVPVAADAHTYLVALVLAVLSGLLFGIVPVRQILRTNPNTMIKAGAGVHPARRVTLRDVLVVVQIAICGVLITSSMVAVRGLVRSLRADFGFDARVVLAGTNLGAAGYSADRVPAMQRRMIDALKTIPGVERVALVNEYPPLLYAAAATTNVFRAETTDMRPANVAATPYRYSVSPDYFEAAGTRVLTGRSFTWHDEKDAPAVAVANREFARRMFGSVAGALGQQFKMQDGTRVQIVGVAEDGKYLSVAEDRKPAIFVPCLQAPATTDYLLVRSRRDPRELTPAIRRTLRELDSGLNVDAGTWASMLDVALFPARVAVVALGVLGAMGVVLSVTGIFGMAAYSVSRRKRELGIRLALGARSGEILKVALGRPIKLLLVGSAAGVGLGMLASRVLAFIVYQATPRDPLVLTGVALVMALVGMLATWIPAQRALALDPVTLLREE